MEYIVSGLICGIVGIVVGLLWLFIKNYRKALKDPDVILSSKLKMSMSSYRDCQEVYKEWYAWRWDKSLQKEMLKPDYKPKRFPKNPNAFHRYEFYMNYIYDIHDWEKLDASLKQMTSYDNPYKKEEYEWIRRQNIPIIKNLIQEG